MSMLDYLRGDKIIEADKKRVIRDDLHVYNNGGLEEYDIVKIEVKDEVKEEDDG